MFVSRRSFIKIGGLLALTTVAVSPQQLFAQTASGVDETAAAWRFSQASFRAAIGTRFLLVSETKAMTATLIKVKNSRPKAGAKQAAITGGECFTLAFLLAENESPAEQGTYTVSHQKLGNLDLLLVPGKSDDDRETLIAVINRLID